MKTFETIKRPSSGYDRLVVISPDAIYMVSRQKGYYCPVKRKGVYIIEPVGMEFSVVNINNKKLKALEKDPDVAIIQTDDPAPDLQALRLKFDLMFYEKAAELFNRYV